MRATLLVVVAHAAALAGLCTAGSFEHAEVLLSSEAEKSELCAAEVAKLQSHLAEVSAENAVLRDVNERLASSLDDCRRAENVEQPPRLIVLPDNNHRQAPPGATNHHHWPGLPDEQLSAAATHDDANAPPLPRVSAPRRRTLATPAPTPLTPIPTPFTPIPTTATPSATPSASPVPTTEGVTTHSQLAAAVADPANSVVVVEADVVFPFFSAIIVDSGRSVSVVGRSAVDGGRVVFDGAGHSQHFWVAGGTLHLTFIVLVNGTASQTDADCIPDLWICRGGSVLVTEAGTLVMRSCDIRGRGSQVTNSYRAGGVGVYGDESSGEFYNCSFTDLCATYGGAFHAGESSGKELATRVKIVGSQFLRNSALQCCVVYIGWLYVLAELHDCLIANNDGVAFATLFNGESTIVRTVFRENTGSSVSWPGVGSAVVISSMASETTYFYDSTFERNIGHAEGSSGGALTMSSNCHLSNCSFLENTALNIAGGAALDVQNGAKVTVTDCFALGNIGVGYSGGFNVKGASIVNCELCYASTLDVFCSAPPRTDSQLTIINSGSPSFDERALTSCGS